jgi:hypothetical protein
LTVRFIRKCLDSSITSSALFDQSPPWHIYLFWTATGPHAIGVQIIWGRSTASD